MLSTACVDFLRAASFEWPEAIELMQTRNAVEAMMQFMKNEELYGAVDMPVWVERTAVGSSVQARARARVGGLGLGLRLGLGLGLGLANPNQLLTLPLTRRCCSACPSCVSRGRSSAG